MKAAVHKISGLALALSLYGLLSPRPEPTMASAIACVAFLPFAFTKIAKIATLLVSEREEEVLTPLRDLIAAYAVLFVLPSWVAGQMGELARLVGRQLDALVARVDEVAPMGMLSFIALSQPFSSFMDNQKADVFHSVLALGALAPAVYFLSVLTPLSSDFSLAVTLLFAACWFLHVLGDAVSREGAAILYPLSNTYVLGDFVESIDLLAKSERVATNLLVGASVVGILALIVSFLSPHVDVNPVYVLYALVGATLLPAPLVLYRSSLSEPPAAPRGLITCPSCGRLVPKGSSLCPYCGREVG